MDNKIYNEHNESTVYVSLDCNVLDKDVFMVPKEIESKKVMVRTSWDGPFEERQLGIGISLGKAYTLELEEGIENIVMGVPQNGDRNKVIVNELKLPSTLKTFSAPDGLLLDILTGCPIDCSKIIIPDTLGNVTFERVYFELEKLSVDTQKRLKEIGYGS